MYCSCLSCVDSDMCIVCLTNLRHLGVTAAGVLHSLFNAACVCASINVPRLCSSLSVSNPVKPHIYGAIYSK